MQALVFDKAESLAFPIWSMGFIGCSRDDEDLFAHVGAASGFKAGRLEGDPSLT